MYFFANYTRRFGAEGNESMHKDAYSLISFRSFRNGCLFVGLTLLSVCTLAPAVYGQTSTAVKITLDQAIQLALAHNHALLAARSTILQSQAEEITAGIRPNPVFTYDDLYLPITPNEFTASNINLITEFDLGAAFTWERGHKRDARKLAAKDQTTVTRSEVYDNERTLTFDVAQQFINVLLATSQLNFARQDLDSFQKTVAISESQYKAGAISEGDYLKIHLQLLQFQQDVSAAQLSLVQARTGLRQYLGYDAVPENFDVAGELAYTPLHFNKQDLEMMALKHRPDLLAASQSVTAANSQYSLAKANGKRDLTTGFTYTHVAGLNAAGFTASIEIPVWDKNQGEIARTHYAIGGAQEFEKAAEDAVMSDVETAYGGLQSADEVARLYESGYLKQARDSREISEYAYRRGAASLLDFLDAERSYRATELAYRQALANYMLAVETAREAAGVRNLP
ncbi:MAG TPA: TolC family protein [Terriglobia bacterium]|nr:TolC family protein [Terriglobia bacterium]